MSDTIPLSQARAQQPCNIAYRRLSDIKAEPIKWLWDKRIARGKITILAGDPGLGKSQLTAFMAAMVTNGKRWPIENAPCPQGNVVFLSAEDDAADTIRPRLEAVGANLPKVFILDAVKHRDDDGKESERGFDLKQDIQNLDTMLKEIGGAVLVVIDPISAYLGGTDSHKNADIRALLSPLSDLAAKHGAAILGVTHLNKGQSKQALQRVTGSLAFVAAARAAYIVAKDQGEPERRLLLPIKNNIGDDKTGFAFSIEGVALSGEISTSRVVFEPDLITERADEILACEGDTEERNALEEAKEFLRELCVIGRTAKNVKAQAEEAGISPATLRRAKDSLGIKPKKDGQSGPWVWRLPDLEDAQKSEDAHEKNVNTFDKFEHLPTQNKVYGDTEVF
ncbi:MAG: AAA family ATPase [Alphaproteobacteria bacterium]|nr:AAA family ATPase [Alphaproteobacteria bacterium]